MCRCAVVTAGPLGWEAEEGARHGNNKLGGKLTEAPAVEVVLVVVLLVGRLYTSLFDPPGLQKTATQYSGSPVRLPANKTRLTGQGQTGHEASYAYVWRRLE